ncbi:uncharacterized protein LOC115962748 isoform X2 [Quercus lobata]|uniref:uncharacterized protein LOC115962745 isoform X2 n=1 Tax=Quercus lobata TaxID=97700 RepID=UPI001248AFC6|nr:uncharacterized protein LOC115962745 isoform X2 [Quercus lobata]XP_030937486.1 uncharacterized protein LOC115962748 isoform X2 [Quercus lobata]
MASITTMMMTTIPSEFQQQPRTSTQSCHLTIGCSHVLTCPKSTCTNFCDMQHYLCRSLLFPSSPQRRGLTRLTKQISASSSGLEASITDQKGKTIKLKSAMIVIESQDENKMQIQVNLTGDETEKVFDQVLTNLARTAPPVPGFRRQKGGKTSQVPKSFLLQMLGEERVTKFVIQEIVNSTMDDYVKNENLNVKDNKINTIQKAEELMSSFIPGKEFRFNAVLELEGSEIKTSS